MGKLVTYSAVADYDGTDYIGEHWTSKVAVENVSDEAIALQHARAMKAVLLAAKAWKRAAAALDMAYERDERVSAGAPKVQRHLGATNRLLAAQERLEKIEKEVKRG